MLLYELLDGLGAACPIKDCEITGVTADSRQIAQGMVFVCIKGTRFDGHDHAKQALKSGAVLVVAEYDLGLENQVILPDARFAYAKLCNNFYGNPAKKLRLIGVTGTNGKTTITCIIKQILERAGKKVGLIGTIQTEIGDIILPAKHTTPDPHALHAIFARMAEAGCEFVVMECSSHALDQHRLAGLSFESAVFTNLTQDHLDYHHDMETYYHAKKKLFSMCKTGIINVDDAYGQRLSEEVFCETRTFSTHQDDADYTAKDIRPAQDSSRFMLVGKGEIARITLPIPGGFSVSNALAAAVACMSVGLRIDEVANGLNHCTGVVGRLEVLPADTNYTIIRDYAHSPDGLEKIVSTMKQFAKGRVVTLFGCAGNRDRSKRKLMAEIAARLSDFVVLTSDNPRDEDEMQIISDAVPGLEMHPDTPYQIIPNRYEAIEWALLNARENDILILAGKGHEDYQVLRGETIYFDEKVIVEEILAKQRS